MLDRIDLSQEFAGRRALVTGGTRGIGAAIARRLLASGAQVVVASRKRSDTMPEGATFVVGDVSTSDGVRAIASEALAALGGLDILVNNAGGAADLPVYSEGSSAIPDEEWQKALDINLFASIRLVTAVLPALRQSTAASIVNISSTAATMPFAPTAQYGVAKAALDFYSRTLAVELAPSGIRVNVVSPGPIVTPSAEEFRKGFPGVTADQWLQFVPLGRLGAPEDIAEVVALFASERGGFLTGMNYRVDGGMTAR